MRRSIEIIAEVIDFIESHLAEHLDLETIAQGVHYSRYHLHRMFTSAVGLTIHAYSLRRRLTEAAKLLVFSDQPILHIALLAGYESQQAFTTAFSAMYKLSPSKYREREQFYPLQLRFQFEGDYQMLSRKERGKWEVAYAAMGDVPCWMELVRLVVDGFPNLREDQYLQQLRLRISTRQALILKDGEKAIGILLFTRETGSIDFMGAHPLYRGRGIPKALLDKVMGELARGQPISITTYRDGDRADTGHRKEIMDLGFAEGELLTEFGYPTQRFIMSQEDKHDAQ